MFVVAAAVFIVKTAINIVRRLDVIIWIEIM
jgi:hypothetical protein